MEKREIRNTGYFMYQDGTIETPKGRTISPWKENNTGYMLFRVRSNNKPLCLRLHRIMAELFIPNPDNKPFVRHLNDIKDDNRLENLAWGDNPTNVQEGYDNNCYKFKNRSYKVRSTHLPTGEVVVYKSLRSCAEALNINRKNLAAVLSGKKNNTYVGYVFEYFEMPND